MAPRRPDPDTTTTTEQLIVVANPDGSVTVSPADDSDAIAAAEAADGQTVIPTPEGAQVTGPVTLTPGEAIPGTDTPPPIPEVGGVAGPIGSPTPDFGAGAGPVDPSPGTGAGAVPGPGGGLDGRPVRDVGTSTLGPSSEAVIPGTAPAPAPEGSPAVVTADPEVVGVEIPEPVRPPTPEPVSERLAIGTHVAAGAEPGGTVRYGLVVEVHVIPGALEPAYRVGWLDTAGGLIPGSQLVTTRQLAEADPTALAVDR